MLVPRNEEPPDRKNRTAARDAKHLEELDILSSELLKEQTLMLPMAYNTAAGPHGRGFIRFPEELNGPGCFGTVLLRILNGSGYSLKWASLQTKLFFTIKDESERSHNNNERNANDYDNISINNHELKLRRFNTDLISVESVKDVKINSGSSFLEECGCTHVQDPNIMRGLIDIMEM